MLYASFLSCLLLIISLVQIPCCDITVTSVGSHRCPTLATSSSSSSSPPEARLYNLRSKRKKTVAKMPNDRANWSDMATKTLLDLCIEQKRLFNWNRLGPSPHGWQNIYPKFEQQTGLHYGHKQVQNKLGTLKRAYQTWKELQNSSGLGRDRNTGGVAADDTYWVPTQGDTSSEQQTHGKPPPFLEELELLFGHTPQDRGTLLTVGGVRESTPTIGSDDTPQEISEDPHSASAVRNTSKRTSRDEVVDSPQKKKSASMEDYVKEM
ncbi:hypothetical protein HU200_015764 [Digitaria exilis]|uniref:Myb/SANT-like domain-containing protein n=1 Tax=Digitaria exilis TaxID=1010633 RepID=A0A835F8N3_9POAL|nr:hypothetical protein HU200_015764 [Digitaria exilis]